MSAKSKARTLRDFESDEILVMWHKEKKKQQNIPVKAKSMQLRIHIIQRI